MIDEKILTAILDAKEERAFRQKELIDRYKSSLISFTLNIPGRVKDNPIYKEIHIEGMKAIKKKLEENDLSILYNQERENVAGREGYIVVDMDSYKIKKITVDIEENHPLGRVFDIDVFSSKNKQISRADLGLRGRSCLLCDLDARVCMREKNHTYEDLIQHIDKVWKRYKKIQILKWEDVMNNKNIGILDSGVGGLTTAREFELSLPNESIIYLGDNKNVPYGNRTEEEIYTLTKKMIDFLIEKDVKIIAVACNTISSIIDKYFSDYNIPIVSIIKPAVEYVIENNIKNIGVIATEFTINSKVYYKYLHEKDKDIKVVTEGCPSLAAIIDKGDYTEEEIQAEIDNHMASILKKGQMKDIILGCTHYPIEIERFKKLGSEINFINPAYEQTIYIKNLMKEQNTSSNKENSTFEVYTTGKKETYLKMIDVLEMKRPDEVYEIEKF